MGIDNDFWKHKKVLITGHTGFKGSWLSLYLNELGAEVAGLALRPNANQILFNQLNLKKKIEHNIVDIRDQKSVSDLVRNINPEIIFHLAAQPLVRESYDNPLETWQTNLIGSLNLLDAIKNFQRKCVVIIITTDKVYENKDWCFGYREVDPLGGHDPYSASKAGLEIAISSWRESFLGNKSYQNPNIFLASVRAGNVIGGGDWSTDRIIPDVIRSLKSNDQIKIRNKSSVRPWQHVLDPLTGYLLLARKIYEIDDFKKRGNLCSAFNFGPLPDSNRTVAELVDEVFKSWKGSWVDISNPNDFHEAKLLKLNIEKSGDLLGWYPKWNFSESIYRTINWYKNEHDKILTPLELCIKDINNYQ